MRHRNFYIKKFSPFYKKKKPLLMSRDIMRFRVRISKKLKNYKAKLFRRYKRLSFMQKFFFRRFTFKSRRRSDLLYLYKKRRFYARWVPKRYFSRKKSRKHNKKKFFIKRIRQRYLHKTSWRSRIRTGYYRKTPKIYATSPFRYQLIDDRYNRKRFRFWLNKRFFGKKKRFVFRIFYFFRKLERLRFNFKTKSSPVPAKLFDTRTFFEKYRKFSIWALSHSWHKFYPRTRSMKRKIRFLRKRRKLLINLKRKRLKHLGRKRNLKIKKKKSKKKNRKKVKVIKKSPKYKKKKKKYREKSFFSQRKRYVQFKFSKRRFTWRRSFRKSRQISRFLRTIYFSYKFPHNKRYFKSKSFLKSNRSKFFKSFSSRFVHFNNKTLKFTRTNNKPLRLFFRFSRRSFKHSFKTKRRVPRLIYKNFFTRKTAPLAYHFTRKFKKFSVYFKTYKKRVHLSRSIKFKHRSRTPFRIKRIFNKLRFYFSKFKRPKFSKKLNKKIFFVRRKYSLYLPYLGYFRRFGRKRFIYKKRRKKFFRFFRKFFSKFHSVSSIHTPRFKFYRAKASRVKFFIHIFRSVNNMFVNVSAPRGRTLYAYSAGRTQFRGSKRLSPIAIETMGKSVSLLLKNSKIFQAAVVFHTPIDYLVRALMRGFRTNIKFTHFKYYITKPHNGLRLRATRRI